MPTEIFKNDSIARFAQFLEDTMGLYYPTEELRDFEKKLAPIATAFGFKDSISCIEWLMKAPLNKEQITTLALYLTVGETYFFRDPENFKILSAEIIPEILKKRINERYIRIWCAACCSGEEPYSVAMMLHEMMPDISNWNITILGTDINPTFLQKAELGIYKEWSFRNCKSEMKKKFFNRSQDGKYHLHENIKKMVTFSYMNLVEDIYPSVMNGTNAMDLILCHNVLMYFSHKQIKKVVRQLTSSLVEGGTLSVSPIETPFIFDSRLARKNYGDRTLFKKATDILNEDEKSIQDPNSDEFPFLRQPVFSKTGSPEKTSQTFFKVELPAFLNLQTPFLEFDFTTKKKQNSKTAANSKQIAELLKKKVKQEPIKELKSQESSYSYALELFSKAQYSEVINQLQKDLDYFNSDDSDNYLKEIILLIRAFANLGKLAEAEKWSEKALKLDKLDPLIHYLYAVILLEMKKEKLAIQSLKRALYLDQNFIMAHFTLANLMGSKGNTVEFKRYLRNTRELLKKTPREELLPGVEEMTADRLAEIVDTMESRL
jgi:chemotaxis protein methyltransferase CheR